MINLLTGLRADLIEHIATHRQVASINAAVSRKQDRVTIEIGAADSIKRVHFSSLSGDDWYDSKLAASPWAIEPFVEMKTIWHPSALR